MSLRLGATAFMGGTFDPIHNGHIRMAIESCEALGLSSLALVPAADPPHRDAPQVNAKSRLAMVVESVKDIPQLEVDGRELLRSGRSYSFDTACEFRSELGGDASLTMIMGADAFLGFMSWHRWQEFLGVLNILVLARPGWSWPEQGELATWVAKHRVGVNDLRSRPSGGLAFLSSRLLDISASDIRKRLYAGLSIDGLVPDVVRHYIAQQKLYVQAEVALKGDD